MRNWSYIYCCKLKYAWAPFQLSEWMLFPIDRNGHCLRGSSQKSFLAERVSSWILLFSLSSASCTLGALLIIGLTTGSRCSTHLKMLNAKDNAHAMSDNVHHLEDEVLMSLLSAAQAMCSRGKNTWSHRLLRRPSARSHKLFSCTIDSN